MNKNSKVNLKLISPAAEFKDEYSDFIQEFLNNDEELIPFSLTYQDEDFYSLIDMINGFSHGKNIPDKFVPVTTFWMIDDQKRIIGVIDIRHQLTENLRYFGGLIGYGIRPSERRKGYAGLMLKAALTKAREIGLKEVLITCKKTNIASSKVIIQNGGNLDSEELINGAIVQRYIIEL